uniref:Uncharacterized protein n=1 Tax=Oryza glumipatula TaxID=40148 RepID=A0A0E0AFK0_9ORYZ
MASMRSSVTESEANTTPYPPPGPLCRARRHMAPSTTGAAASGDEVAGVEALGKGEGEDAELRRRRRPTASASALERERRRWKPASFAGGCR